MIRTTNYPFGDIDATVTFTAEGTYLVAIEAVTLPDGHDIMGLLPERVLRDIEQVCVDEIYFAA